MKIYLFLSNKLYKFFLPIEVSGSFSFDVEEDSQSKLINIEARDGGWYLYSTGDSEVIDHDGAVDEILIKENNYYVLKRDNIHYLIFAAPFRDRSVQPFAYANGSSLVVGNSEDCSLYYQCEYIHGRVFSLSFSDEAIVLSKEGEDIYYVNNSPVREKQRLIRLGDTITLYGLNILVAQGLIIINSPLGHVGLNEAFTNIRACSFQMNEELTNLDVKDEELYKKSDYFSKAPRLRRIIKTKDIDLDKPPSTGNGGGMPLLLTLGPMFTMGITSIINFANTMNRIRSGGQKLSQNIPSLITSLALLASMFLWPLLTNFYHKRTEKKRKKELIKKYTAYLKKKEVEFADEVTLQRSILIENLIKVEECANIIQSKNVFFWSKRIDQSDFLEVRIGVGDERLNVKVAYPREGFTMDEDELKKQADDLVRKYMYIENVPIGYSLYKNIITDVMGDYTKDIYFINNIFVQLLSFYSYEDLKIVVFTNEQNTKYWEYLKYLNHNFSSDKSIRLYAVDSEDKKALSQYLDYVVSERLNQNGNHKGGAPYYLIFTDDYDSIRKFNFIEIITESDENLGFSLLILENKMSNLPSKCNNFINLGEKTSGLLTNSYDEQEQKTFYDEINYKIDMMSLVRKLANVPILSEEASAGMPESINFMEMEKVGKVKQLNILNRWNTNDPTQSLKAEIGVDTTGDIMYLDLHEKAHGPHGLIAGMTGSGKSEFIITYILSMAINYSPDYVSFILIDYKGGGLAFAFENQTSNIVLPHLAGTITNLDKAEMDRTLVSIDSEAKRRQGIFNQVREELGESTMDIYKYQKFYQEGRIKEAVPHLFIICDEFAELKSQQPDFMDNLISIARIGRSLGIHLILATQKPSGVVNDQIWSNSRFHICLKVQDASDSNEMLKKPDAANIKQVGRFFMQVGYDEFFALGQSAWCGAKYFPSESIVKQADKSVEFIDSVGMVIKKIQAGSDKNVQPEGEQLIAVLKEIVEVSRSANKKADRLWLENIPETILVDQLFDKYKIKINHNEIKGIIGEYDAPERQEQGLLEINYLSDGNTILYSQDGQETEGMLDLLLYYSITRYSSTDLNFYIIDYGSQSLRKYEKSNFVGGIVTPGEDDKYRSIFKMLREEIDERKLLLADYNGDYQAYISQTGNKLPLKIVILNNYEAINDNDKNLYDNLPEYVRDSERFGIIFIMTGTGVNSVPRRVSQSCPNLYAFKLKDDTDYLSVFSTKKKLVPRNMFGRGIFSENKDIHEFQLAKIVEDESELNQLIINKILETNVINPVKAKPIPCVPNQVTIEYVESAIKDLSNVPIGINKLNTAISKYDFLSSIITPITAYKLDYTRIFTRSLIDVFLKMEKTILLVIDSTGALKDKSEQIKYYYSGNIKDIQQKINSFVRNLNNKDQTTQVVVLIYGLNKYLSKLEGSNALEDLLGLITARENSSVIVCEDINKLKAHNFDAWFTSNMVGNGLYIGNGIANQTTLKVNNYSNELSKDFKNDIIFNVSDGVYELAKKLEFEKEEEEVL